MYTFGSAPTERDLYLVHLVVSGNVLVQGSQHDHGHHARQEEDNDEGIHDAGEKHTGHIIVS